MKKLTVLIGLSLALLCSCKRKKAETVSPVLSPITEAVFAPGHIEAANEFTVTAFNDGYLNAVLVEEGDRVSAGQTLFVQDNSTALIQQQASAQNLRIAQEQAAANSAVFQQLQAQLNAANDKLKNDKVQLERMQRLYPTHSVAKLDVDNAELNYNNSVNNVNALQQNIAETRLNLQQAVINSRSQEQTAAANIDYYNIKSPGNYKVYTLLKKKGEMVRKGEAVAILGSGDQLKIVLSVDEASIEKIQLGQKVLVELNTQKNKTYTAGISKIYPAFDADMQAYKVEAVSDNFPAAVINGTLLQANIIVAHKARALLIPQGTLTADGKVILKRDNETDTVSIQTGIISTQWIEVLKGLSLQDKLVKR